MSNLGEFKEFVRKNPGLVKYVRNNEMTWQKFYEMYDLYGTENEVWKDYLETKQSADATATVAGFDLINWLKNIDIDSFQENINSVRRVIGVLQDLSTKEGSSSTSSTGYKPRPLYKHFED